MYQYIFLPYSYDKLLEVEKDKIKSHIWDRYICHSERVVI